MQNVLIEARLSDTEPSPALKKFQGVLKRPAIQLVEKSKGKTAAILSTERF